MTREPPMMPVSGRADPGHVDSLVAAAPDMLAALKAIADPLTLPSEGVGLGKAMKIIAAQKNIALAAIAKAEGR